MAQQAPLEPGSALYELATSADLTKVPEKLICKNCTHFLLNAFKTACCEGSLCETCNSAATGSACPLCKHDPLITNPSKALRGTARSYLKSNLANAEANRQAETTPSVPPVDQQETGTVQVVDSLAENGLNGKTMDNDQDQGIGTPVQDAQESIEQSVDVVQSIEEPREMSRRQTMDSASGNENDDDEIEINVGSDYDVSQVPEQRRSPVDEGDQWSGDQQYYQEQPRKNSTKPHKQDQSNNNSFNNDSNANMNQFNSPLEAQTNMQQFMQSGFDGNPNMMSNNPQIAQMQIQMQQMLQMSAMMGMPMPNMQAMMNGMGMPQMPGMMNGQNQNWGGNMMPFGNQNFNPMMNNGASFSQGQQYNQNFQNGDFRDFGRQGNFTRGGRGRKNRGGGRGGGWQDFNNNPGNWNHNKMPYQNQYGPGSMNYSQQNQHDNRGEEPYQTNNDKEAEHEADDDEFAPGGQDEIKEALGESYNKKTSIPPEEVKTENATTEVFKQEEMQDMAPIVAVEQPPVVDSPKQEVKDDIPEAYREDLDFASVPPSAPSGPSAKDVPFRQRGHGRFPSRGGRGSYHGSLEHRSSFQNTNGYPPRSPARPVSQSQNVSPTAAQAPGVVGAPTGPRAMREKDVPPPVKAMSRAESDVGFKIRGTATQSKREEVPRSATPKSAYDDYDDGRDKDLSRRQTKYDRDHKSSKSGYYEAADDYDTSERDRVSKRRKSHRQDDLDHEMEDVEHSNSYSRADSVDRESRRSGRRDRDREKEKEKDRNAKDKYSSRKSSRRHEEEPEPYNGATNNNDTEYPEETTTRSTRDRPSKKSSRHDDRDRERDRDRDERRDRDAERERAERDKHRKRSRHDRDREDNHEDEDEEESRRRSRKHKKEHDSSRKDRDRDREARHREGGSSRSKNDDTDLGLRITGRSHQSNLRNSETVTSTAAQPDKDPHTLEREARNKERMLKEQQRREKAEAAKGSGGGGLSGGRTKSYKYEDEIERSLGLVGSKGHRHRR